MINYFYNIRKYLSEKISQNEFSANVAVLTLGSAGAQIIAVGFSPLLTRIYSPEAFGLLGTFLAMITLASPISTLAYHFAVSLPEKERDATDIVKISLILLIISTTIIFILSLIFSSYLDYIFPNNYNNTFLISLPLAVFSLAVYQINEQWLIRKKQFKSISIVTFVSSLISNISKMIFGIFVKNVYILTYVSVVNMSLQAVLIIIFSNYFGTKVFLTKSLKLTAQRISRYKRILRIYRDFPLYRAPQIFINILSESLPILMLTSFFGPASAGYYSISRLVLGTPTSVVGKAISDVFYPKIAIASRGKNNIALFILRPTLLLAVIAILPFTLLFIFAPTVFSFIFGSEWAEAGVYTRWLSIFFFFNFINKPSVAAVPVLGIQRGLLWYEMLSTAIKLIALAVGIYIIKSDVWSIALFSCAGAVAYLCMIIWIYLCAERWRK